MCRLSDDAEETLLVMERKLTEEDRTLRTFRR